VAEEFAVCTAGASLAVAATLIASASAVLLSLPLSFLLPGARLLRLPVLLCRATAMAAEEKTAARPQALVAAAIYREHEDSCREYLLVRDEGGAWTLPLGPIRVGESVLAAAARQVQTHTGAYWKEGLRFSPQALSTWETIRADGYRAAAPGSGLDSSLNPIISHDIVTVMLGFLPCSRSLEGGHELQWMSSEEIRTSATVVARGVRKALDRAKLLLGAGMLPPAEAVALEDQSNAGGTKEGVAPSAGSLEPPADAVYTSVDASEDPAVVAGVVPDAYTGTALGAAREAYCLRMSGEASASLKEVEAATIANLQLPQMTSSALSGHVLAMLVAITGSRRILEIGSYTGYSAIAMAEALPVWGQFETASCKIVCLDPFVDEAGAEAIFRDSVRKSGFESLIELRKVHASTGLKTLREESAEPFDFIFIDADKESQIEYYEDILGSGLLANKGVIVVDNTLWYSRVLRPREHQDETDRAVSDFNEHVRDDPRTRTVVLPVRDGLTLIQAV